MPAERQSRTQAERREEAEHKLLNAGIRLLVDKGYGRFTLAEVGDLAGYSRGLPAHYFGKKDDFLSEVARYIVERYRADVTHIDRGKPGLERVSGAIRRYSSNTNSRPSRALWVLSAEAPLNPKIKRTIVDLNQQGIRNWERVLQGAMETGEVRADLETHSIASMIFAFLRGQIAFAALDPNYNVEATTEAFIEVLTLKLKPEKARRKASAPGQAQELSE
jgi:AcrR family transcriptional regulator